MQEALKTFVVELVTSEWYKDCSHACLLVFSSFLRRALDPINPINV